MASAHLSRGRKRWGRMGESAGLFVRVNLRLGGFSGLGIGMGQLSCWDALKGTPFKFLRG